MRECEFPASRSVVLQGKCTLGIPISQLFALAREKDLLSFVQGRSVHREGNTSLCCVFALSLLLTKDVAESRREGRSIFGTVSPMVADEERIITGREQKLVGKVSFFT